MRKLKLIGIGAGHPDYITVQAINALRQVDVVFLTDKGTDASTLLRVRQQICERYMDQKPYRTVEITDPERDRTASYLTAVGAWHHERAALYEELIRDNVSENECGAFLIWGDPCLYDSALRIIDRISARGSLEIDWEMIPGISSIQALAARHRISLNEIGAPVHITTGRRLANEPLTAETNVAVLLDGHCTFKALEPAGVDIYWGAYLGMPDEILISGSLSERSEEIQRVRSEARERNGWIMDLYLLRKRPPNSY